MFGASSSNSTIAAGTTVSVQAGSVDILSGSMAATGSTLSVSATTASVFSDRDISFTVANAVSVSTPTEFQIGGSTGSFLATGQVTVQSVEASVGIVSMGDLSVNSGGSMALTAQNGVVVESVHEDVVILVPSGKTTFNGTNVALRGTDGLSIQSNTDLTATAGQSLVLFSDEASFTSGSSFTIQTTDLAANINVHATGSIVATSASLGLTGSTVTITAPQSVGFLGSGSLHLAVSNPITFSSSVSTTLNGGTSTLINGNGGVSASAVRPSRPCHLTIDRSLCLFVRDTHTLPYLRSVLVSRILTHSLSLSLSLTPGSQRNLFPERCRYCRPDFLPSCDRYRFRDLLGQAKLVFHYYLPSNRHLLEGLDIRCFVPFHSSRSTFKEIGRAHV